MIKIADKLLLKTQITVVKFQFFIHKFRITNFQFQWTARNRSRRTSSRGSFQSSCRLAHGRMLEVCLSVLIVKATIKIWQVSSVVTTLP